MCRQSCIGSVAPAETQKCILETWYISWVARETQPAPKLAARHLRVILAYAAQNRSLQYSAFIMPLKDITPGVRLLELYFKVRVDWEGLSECLSFLAARSRSTGSNHCEVAL